jgi:hypothetical protein
LATALKFNQEIIFGEIGSLGMAYVAAFTAKAFQADKYVISTAMVAGTLLGGTLLWLALRIHHRQEEQRFSVGGLASDISYFTPAALTFGFGVYDPALFFVSHHLLVEGVSVAHTVIMAQIVAFTLFLGCMNLYRAVLLKTKGKRL